MNETPDGPDGDEDDTSKIEEEIATLSTLISQARELVATGHSIDLGGLSDKVGEFCASVAADPPADAESVTRMIEALVTDLNALAAEITAQHQDPASGGGSGGGSGGNGNGS